MSDIVEKVARALCAFDGIDPDSNAFPDFEDDEIPAWKRLNYQGRARAAIAAMREAGSNAHVQMAGAKVLRELRDTPMNTTSTVESIYRAMIDAALKETDNGQ